MSNAQDFYARHYQDQEQGAAGPESEATFHLRVRAALQAIGRSPRRVLDFGCGTGAASSLIAEAGHHVVGVDVSESGLRLAERNVLGATFELIHSESELPFPDGSFDVCFATEVIEHLLDVRGFIREVPRILAHDGRFVITTPYHRWIKNLIIITRNFDRHFDPTWGHIRFFSRSSLNGCLADGGFRVEQFSGIGRRWPVWKSMFVVARKVD